MLGVLGDRRVRLSTNMPSVCASDGKRIAPRPCGRHGAGGGGSAASSGSSRRAHSSTSRSRRASACTPRTRAGRRACTAAAAAASRTRCSAARSRDVGRLHRHRASGRRRSTPSPLHGASSSTRSNAPSRTGGWRPSATIVDDRLLHADALRRPHDGAHAPGVQVGGDDEPVVAHALRGGRRLAARRRRRRRARARPAAGRGPRRSPGSPGPGAWPDRRRSRAAPRGRPRGAPTARRARACPARRRRPSRTELGGQRLGRGPHRVHPQRHRRRLVVELERRDRVGGPERVDEEPHDPVGMRRPDRDRRDVVAARAAGRAAPARQARAAHRSRSRGRARRRLRRSRPPRRAPGRRSAAGTRRGAPRPAPADRATRCSGSRRPKQDVERALHRGPCRRPGRSRGRGRAVDSRELRRACGTRMCANAPSSMREQRVERDLRGTSRRTIAHAGSRRGDASHPGSPRGRRS